MSEDNSQLPPELDWEQMQDGIFEKMNELQSQEKSTNKYFSIRNIFIVSAIVLIILLSQLICSPKDVKFASEDSTALESRDVTEILQPTNTLSKIEEKTNASSAVKDAGYSNSENPLTSDISLEIKSTSNLISNSKKSNSINQARTIKASIVDNNSVNKNFIDETTNNQTSKNKDGENEKRPLNTSLIETRNHTVISNISTKQLFVDTEPISVILPSFYFNKVTPLSIPKNKGRLSLIGGLSLWTAGYGNPKPERSEYENTMPSFNAQLNYFHPLKKNYTLMIGFQILQLESQFDYSASLDNQTITLTDTIIQIQNNLITGKQTEIRGDVEVAVDAVRNVKHYNTIKIYQIPFAIGKTWISNKWQTDLLIGGTVNILTNNEGRTLFNDEIQDYNSTSTDFLSNQWKLNAMITGRLTYRLNDQFGITTGIQLQRSLINWSTEQNIKMHPSIISLEFGVNYSL